MTKTPLFLCGLIAAILSGASVTAQTDDELDSFSLRTSGRLEQHPYFKETTILEPVKKSPFVFFIERPTKDDPAYPRKVTNAYLPFLGELRRLFLADYVQSLGLKSTVPEPRYAIVVLNSRGSYQNYAQAVKVSSLNHARAHYDPNLGIAVSYIDKFAAGNTGPEERQAVLHEFVHALQHAYSATDRMPQPTWYNEGLAEYRSTSTNVASSLRSPQVDQLRLKTLANAMRSERGSRLVAPLTDLLAPTNYADIIRRANRRTGGRFNSPDLPLGVFYAQAAAFVEFMHEAEDGRYRPVFDAFMKAAQDGSRGVLVFKRALEANKLGSLDDLDQAFRLWAAEQIEKRLRIRIRVAAADDEEGEEVATRAKTPTEPEDFDAAEELAWTEDENDARLAGARALCAQGRFAAAIAILPADTEGLSGRLRARADAAQQAREKLFAFAEKKGKRLAPLVDGKRVGGKLVSRTKTHVVLDDRKKGKQKLPISVFDAKNLAIELKKHKQAPSGAAVLAWLDWLGGKPAKTAMRKLSASDPLAKDLANDMQGKPTDSAGLAAATLARLQQLELPDNDPDAARELLDEVVTAVGDHGEQPVLNSRKDQLRSCVRALAERAFSLANPECLGLSGKMEKLDGGRIRVRYAAGAPEIARDFKLAPLMTDSLTERMPKLAVDGATLVRSGESYEMQGSGVFAWALPTAGETLLKVELSINDFAFCGLINCAHPNDGYILAGLGIGVLIFDRRTELFDSISNAQQELMVDTLHTLEIKHSGKQKMTASFDGTQVAKLTRVGKRTRGISGLFVHSSSIVSIYDITVEAAIDPGATDRLRDAYVERVLKRLAR